jgi:hypothetical protein
MYCPPRFPKAKRREMLTAGRRIDSTVAIQQVSSNSVLVALGRLREVHHRNYVE